MPAAMRGSPRSCSPGCRRWRRAHRALAAASAEPCVKKMPTFLLITFRTFLLAREGAEEDGVVGRQRLVRVRRPHDPGARAGMTQPSPHHDPLHEGGAHAPRCRGGRARGLGGAEDRAARARRQERVRAAGAAGDDDGTEPSALFGARHAAAENGKVIGGAIRRYASSWMQMCVEDGAMAAVYEAPRGARGDARGDRGGGRGEIATRSRRMLEAQLAAARGEVARRQRAEGEGHQQQQEQPRPAAAAGGATRGAARGGGGGGGREEEAAAGGGGEGAVAAARGRGARTTRRRRWRRIRAAPARADEWRSVAVARGVAGHGAGGGNQAADSTRAAALRRAPCGVGAPAARVASRAASWRRRRSPHRPGDEALSALRRRVGSVPGDALVRAAARRRRRTAGPRSFRACDEEARPAGGGDADGGGGKLGRRPPSRRRRRDVRGGGGQPGHRRRRMDGKGQPEAAGANAARSGCASRRGRRMRAGARGMIARRSGARARSRHGAQKRRSTVVWPRRRRARRRRRRAVRLGQRCAAR